MKILVFGGSGKIGTAVAWDLARDEEVETIGLVGRHGPALERVRAWAGSDKIISHVLDIDARADTVALMKTYDAAAVVLPDRKTSYKVLEASIEAGLSSVDALEEFHRTPDPYEIEGLGIPGGLELEKYGEWLHRRALDNGVTFLDGMGFAPGLSNVTCGEGMRLLDSTERVVARVGGIPSKEAAARHPLRYMITWSFQHVLREYMIRLKVIRGGRVVEVDAGTDREQFEFSRFGKHERLECAVTPGMPSFLFTRPGLQEFSEKTVRWPGHWEGVDTLKECGLLEIEPVDFEGRDIVPRAFLSHLLTPRLVPREGDTDVCVMYNTVEGTKSGRRKRLEYFMWDEADRRNGLTSMMRVTGFPVAIAARWLARGRIRQRGIVAPEDTVSGELYRELLSELQKREIEIHSQESD